MSKALSPEQIDEARRMRERGASWREIGRSFGGVRETTVQCAVDPIYAERMREKLRLWRKANGINSRGRVTDQRRDPRPVPKPVAEKPVAARPFMTPSGIMAYRVTVTNRLATHPMEGPRHMLVTLPYVSWRASGEGEPRP